MEYDMKKMTMILATWLMLTSHVQAQMVQENEAAIVYYMPKTELVITLEYDVIKRTPGAFYQYAERYLGTKEVVIESSVSYNLQQMKVDMLTSADTERAYKVTPQKGVNTQLLALSEDGRLLGYNIGLDTLSDSKPNIQNSTCKTQHSTSLMPLLEEHFMATSIAKMAEGAAKMIYRIRETRLNILAGDVEHVPADGEAMRLVLNELNQQEQELVELFVGKTSIEHGTHTVVYTPQENVEREVVCRLSQHNGVVSKDDLSGEPIYLTLEASKQSLDHMVESNSKAPMLSQIYYNLPGSAKLTIEYKNKNWVSAAYQIAQYGVAIPLAQDLFIGKQAPIIHINPRTGNILSIQ